MPVWSTQTNATVTPTSETVLLWQVVVATCFALVTHRSSAAAATGSVYIRLPPAARARLLGHPQDGRLWVAILTMLELVRLARRMRCREDTRK